jgi:hypothetical protein
MLIIIYNIIKKKKNNYDISHDIEMGEKKVEIKNTINDKIYKNKSIKKYKQVLINDSDYGFFDTEFY